MKACQRPQWHSTVSDLINVKVIKLSFTFATECLHLVSPLHWNSISNGLKRSFNQSYNVTQQPVINTSVLSDDSPDQPRSAFFRSETSKITSHVWRCSLKLKGRAPKSFCSSNSLELSHLINQPGWLQFFKRRLKASLVAFLLLPGNSCFYLSVTLSVCSPLFFVLPKFYTELMVPQDFFPASACLDVLWQMWCWILWWACRRGFLLIILPWRSHETHTSASSFWNSSAANWGGSDPLFYQSYEQTQAEIKAPGHQGIQTDTFFDRVDQCV